ncbi:twin-arginine translocase subunit TatC [Flavicella sediminum]|uniref:twin-arginine translocase subunit TatC n=1 Tax=Flavicella sediminum TaxID=2585141 RepID=UPI0011243B08|nr:twin-arginine translocase subunit TatC [Flavicella sediminum]
MSEEKNQMSFLGHLEELRWHLVRSTAAIFICGIVLFVFKTEVYDHFLLAHLKSDFVTYQWFCDVFKLIGVDSDFCGVQFPQKLQSLSLTNQLMNAIWSSLILGLIIAFPYVLWELWRFISPGLHETEVSKSKGFLFITSVLFFTGVLFSFYVIVPMSVYFFYHFEITDTIQNNFTLSSYISMVTNTILGVSVVFELPVLIFFLTKLGLITPQFLKTYRKHALVVVLLLSAIITPPDVASQIIVSIPILILYEVSIHVSKFVVKKQEKGYK